MLYRMTFLVNVVRESLRRAHRVATRTLTRKRWGRFRNADINNLSKPLSHAALIIHHINGTWPAETDGDDAAATHS